MLPVIDHKTHFTHTLVMQNPQKTKWNCTNLPSGASAAIKPWRKIHITLCLKSMISVRHRSEKVTDARSTTIFMLLRFSEKMSKCGASGSSERDRMWALTVVIQFNYFLHLKRVKVTGRESRQWLGSLVLLIRILMFQVHRKTQVELIKNTFVITWSTRRR